MLLQRPLALLAALVTGLTLASCSSPAATPTASTTATPTTLSVVASTDVWGGLAATVGGDRVTVTSIIAARAGGTAVWRTLVRTLAVGVGTMLVSYTVGLLLLS